MLFLDDDDDDESWKAGSAPLPLALSLSLLPLSLSQTLYSAIYGKHFGITGKALKLIVSDYYCTLHPSPLEMKFLNFDVECSGNRCTHDLQIVGFSASMR
ncbi:hypothetical protein VNO77_33785 [Canavalia gladiata]|uniref:Uncharacterized protein n=1 Tax=Canavalia gladiata TaxID=3824 RepID=A0AAN9KEV7_CANGL